MRESVSRSLFRLISVILVLAPPLFSQTVSQPPLKEIVDLTQKQTRVYVETFKNLLTEETKTFEIYDKKGAIKKRRVVISNFIVYQLSKDESQITEYRNVVSVDGEKVYKADQRAEDFFEKLVKAETSGKEFEKLEEESLRYDDDILITGLTLTQAPALSETMRSFFEFKLVGREFVDGANTLVVSFEQTRASPDVAINPNNRKQIKKPTVSYEVDVDADSPLNERMRGKFWIDADTYQIKREHREITIQPQGFEKPLVVISDEFFYEQSAFGILTPKKIVHLHYRVKAKDREVFKEAKVTLEYNKFTKPDVEVKSSEVK